MTSRQVERLDAVLGGGPKPKPLFDKTETPSRIDYRIAGQSSSSVTVHKPLLEGMARRIPARVSWSTWWCTSLNQAHQFAAAMADAVETAYTLQSEFDRNFPKPKSEKQDATSHS